MAERNTVQVKLIDMAHGGEAVGRLDNRVIFASLGLPGETVEVEIESSKKNFLRGRVKKVVDPSPNRVQPRCEYFGRCGGCQWQHIEYQKQLQLKRQIVIDQLRRVGKLEGVDVRPVIGADDPWHYRNNARFAVDGRSGSVGFVGARSHQVQDIDNCHLVHPHINEVLAALRGRVGEAPGAPAPQGGFEAGQVVVRHGLHTGRTLISPKLELEGFPLESGQEYLDEKLLGKTFRVSAGAFFQVNTLQAEAMAQAIIEQLDPAPEDTVIDAYCGVGTFGLLIASRVKRVVGIEESLLAYRDAVRNARGTRNVEMIHGETEAVLPGIDAPGALVILDPPRQGCHIRTIDALRPSAEELPASAKGLSTRRVAYVSCDPATLARDLRLLVDRGFVLKHVQPVDIFPQTYHIEALAILDG